MSSKPMVSINLPGLDDTYTYVQLDSGLTTSGKAADAAVVGAAVSGLQATDTALTRQLGQVVTETVNLYDKTARTVGSSINSSGVVVEGSTIYDTSDYIPVTAGTKYIGKVDKDGTWATGPFSANGYYATYKADKTFIERGAANSLIDGVTMGETVAYIRVMIRKDSIASAPEYAVIADEGHFPAGYVAYGEHGYIYAAALATQAELDAALSTDFAHSASIAGTQGDTASANIASGDLLMHGGVLYKASQAIVSGAAITPGTNVTATTLAQMMTPSAGTITYTSQSYINTALSSSSWVKYYPFGFALLRLFVPVTSALPTDGTKVAAGTVSPAPSTAVYAAGVCNSADGIGQIEVEITTAGVINVSTRGVSKPSSGWGNYNILIPYLT